MGILSSLLASCPAPPLGLLLSSLSSKGFPCPWSDSMAAPVCGPESSLLEGLILLLQPYLL